MALCVVLEVALGPLCPAVLLNHDPWVTGSAIDGFCDCTGDARRTAAEVSKLPPRTVLKLDLNTATAGCLCLTAKATRTLAPMALRKFSAPIDVAERADCATAVRCCGTSEKSALFIEERGWIRELVAWFDCVPSPLRGPRCSISMSKCKLALHMGHLCAVVGSGYMWPVRYRLLLAAATLAMLSTHDECTKWLQGRRTVS